MRSLAAVLAMAALVVACGGELPDLTASAERQLLAGHKFESVSVEIAGHPAELIKNPSSIGDSHLVIWFGWGWIIVKSGCNSYSTQGWEVRNGRMQAGREWTGTIMGCNLEQEAQDTWFKNFITSSPALSSGD
ncbi:MAG: hypothetical protein QFC55_01975, partial [Chloroflexota bacterium]|nr:hypothetical protein [Chloroflexota bacterium]